MKQARLENLADGIFAIVMTLMVLEIKVPVILSPLPGDFIKSLMQVIPYFMSYLVSFALLYTYWQTHHFITSVYAKTLNVTLSNINAIFLFLIGLVPFSSHFLGSYSNYRFAIVLFALHVIAIGCSLYYMREYIKKSKHIEIEKLTRSEENHAQARVLFPVFCGIVAIGISFVNPALSLVFLTFGILFNFSRKSTHLTFKIIKWFYPNLEG